MKILITGGAGFIGSNIALKLKRDFPEYKIIAFLSYFLSLIYKIFVQKSIVVKFFQAFFSIISIGILIFLSKILFGEKVSFISGLIFAFYPFSIYYDAYLLRETLLVFLAISIVYFLFQI